MNRPAGREIFDYLMDRSGDFVAFLEQLTLAESPSVVPAVQDKVRGIISDRLDDLGFRTFKISGRSNGGNLYARPEGRTTSRPAQSSSISCRATCS